jgi:hypothetical protein
LSRVVAPSFFVLALVVCAGVALRPIPDNPALVIVPPWLPAEAGLQIVLEAGGRVLASEGEGRVIRARFDQPGFAGQLYARGAALVLASNDRPCTGSVKA